MPDAAKLTAALCIAALACVASVLFMPLMPDSTDFGQFVPVNAVIGAAVGWSVTGRRVGHGFAAAMANGLGGAFLLVLWTLFVHSSVQMFDRALDNWYNGAFDALAAVIGFTAEYGLVMLEARLLLALALGGAVAGLATEYAGRRWR